MTNPAPALTPAEILNQAADLVDEGWTTDALARDAKGEIVHERDPAATCRCALGAIWCVGLGGVFPTPGAYILPTKKQIEASSAAIVALTEVIGHGRIGPWNDTPGRTAAEVAETMRLAAQNAKTPAE